MIFRNAVFSDLKDICNLHKVCFPNNFSTHLTRGKKLLMRYYEEYLKTEPELFFVAISNDQLVGFCMGYKRENNMHEDTFLKRNKLSIALNVFWGLVRFDKVVFKRVFKRNKKCVFSIVNKYFNDEVKKDKGDLLSICVLPEYRNKGIASNLLYRFEGALVSIGRSYNQLCVETNNLSAIKFYKKNNYKCFAESANSIKMFKELICN